MVNSWYMNNNDEEDQRSPRHLSPPKYVSLDELKEKTGVLYWKVFSYLLINMIFICIQ